MKLVTRNFFHIRSDYLGSQTDLSTGDQILKGHILCRAQNQNILSRPEIKACNLNEHIKKITNYQLLSFKKHFRQTSIWHRPWRERISARNEEERSVIGSLHTAGNHRKAAKTRIEALMDDFFSSINGRMCRLGGIEWEPSNSSDIFVLDVRQLFPRHIIVISIVPPVREESKAKELTYPHLVFSWSHVTCAYIESSKLMFLNTPFKSRWKMHLVSNKFTCKLIN